MARHFDHPVIDADGHLLEITPFLRDDVLAYAREFGGPKLVEKVRNSPLTFDDEFLARWYRMTDAERRERWEPIVSWWSQPGRTSDRALAFLPSYLAERMDVIGIDYAFLYPSLALGFPLLADDDVRAVACRAYNAAYAEMYRPCAERMTPVGIVPCHTPTEAIEEVEHCVNVLGLKAVVMSHVPRPIGVPGVRRDPEASRYAFRIDTLGIDSEYDYDPLWRRCEELGVAVGLHSGDIGMHTRRSVSRYSFNHMGSFAAANDALAKSLFMDGVTWRFPKLNFAFLEGGVGWAAILLADMVGHWEKRGTPGIANLDPANIDLDELDALFAKHIPDRYRARLGEIREYFAAPMPHPPQLDDWWKCSIGSTGDIVEHFTSRFYFGCEADDPMNALAFNRALNPDGAALRAVFASDLGHWDVSDADHVVEEAYELVERELITEADFRDFMFTNPVRLYAENNPSFFDGTCVERAVRELHALG